MRLPDFYADRLAALLAGEEIRVLICMARVVEAGPQRVSVKRLVGMTGLNERTVRQTLDCLEAARVVIRSSENDPRTNAGCEYQVSADETSILWGQLEGQGAERRNRNCARTAAAREKRGLAVGQQDPPSDNGSSCRTTGPPIPQPDHARARNKVSPSGTDPDPEAPLRGDLPNCGRSSGARARGMMVQGRQPHRVEHLDYTTEQARRICVQRACGAWVAAVRSGDPASRPVIAANDRQAVKNAASALRDAGSPDWLAVEEELVGYVQALAEEGRPLSALSWKLNELRSPGSVRRRTQAASKSPTVESLEDAHRRNMIALGVEDGTE